MLAWPWSSGAGRGAAAWRPSDGGACAAGSWTSAARARMRARVPVRVPMRLLVRVRVGLCELLGGPLGLVRVRVAVGGFLVVAEIERRRPPVGLVGVVVPVVGEVPHRPQDPAAHEDGELHDRGLAT